MCSVKSRSDLLVEVGYIGNVSHHLTANDLTFESGCTRADARRQYAQLVRPFPQFSNVTWINPSIGNSTYHGGFIRAEKRLSGRLSFLAHYTFSKFIDDVEAANEYRHDRQLHGRVQSPARQRSQRQRRASPLRRRIALRIAEAQRR